MKFSNKSLVVLFVTFLSQSTYFLHGHVTTPPGYNIPEIPKDRGNKYREDILFAALTSQNPTVITGYMNNCSNCKTFMAFLEKIFKKYPKVNFWIVNGPAVKLHEKIAERSSFKIPGYPSTAFIKNGIIQKVQIGGNPKTFEENIKTLLK